MDICIALCMASVFVAQAAVELRAAEARKPNIILIFSDDYGTPGVGCYGGAHKTPNLDALAAEGLRFTHCYSMPLCGPSRGVTMSGRYPFRNGVVTNGAGNNYKPSDSPSLAVTMKKAGYATAVAGKWRQLSYFETVEDARTWGFDEFMVWGSGPSKGERYWNVDFNRNGKLISSGDQYGPDLLQEFVVDFVHRRRDEPFFVYYPIPLVHSPILRTPDSKQDEQRKGKNGNLYEDNVAYLDKLVGKLVAELDKSGLRENTLIVFTGDNGSTGGAMTVDGKQIDGRKGTMLEGGSNVPLIINWKGVTPVGKVIEDPVDFSDFYATFADVGGAKLPSDVKFDGRSLAPQIHGEKGDPRKWAFVQLEKNWFARSHGWKLDQSGRLFDMKNAPHEQIAVAADSDDPDAVAARKELQAALDELKPEEGKPSAGGAKIKKKAKKKAAK